MIQTRIFGCLQPTRVDLLELAPSYTRNKIDPSLIPQHSLCTKWTRSQ